MLILMVRFFIILVYFYSHFLVAAEPTIVKPSNIGAKPKVPTNTFVTTKAAFSAQPSAPKLVAALKSKPAKPMNYYTYYQIFNNLNKVIGYAYIKISEDRNSDSITRKQYVTVDSTANGTKRRFDSVGYLKTDLQGFLKTSEVNYYRDKKWRTRVMLKKDSKNFLLSRQRLGEKTTVIKLPTEVKLVPGQLMYFVDLTTNIKNVKAYHDFDGTVQSIPVISTSKKNELTEINLDYGKEKRQRFLYDREYELLEYDACEVDKVCYYLKKKFVPEKILESNPQKAYFDKNI